MKKILTIVATALLSTIAGTAHAQTAPAPATVNFSGNIDSNCSITAGLVPGVLAPNSLTAPTELATTTTPATVKVICNGATSLGLGSPVITGPMPASALTTTYNFSGGTGIFSTVTSGISTTAVTESTDAGGDTANISAKIVANGGKLLKASTAIAPYGVTITATIVP